jgi:CRISPR-associated protein Cas5h
VKILSFELEGSFAAFRDPTVTTNQTVYYIPSKSAVVGLLGAMIGVERDLVLGDLYGKAYLDLFSTTKIGICMKSEPKKVTFFTNHRSFKEAKTKPFKTELVEDPKYRIYVNCSDENIKKLESAISTKNFVYTPYLGHAYCPAVVNDLRNDNASEASPNEKITECVILDESETYNDSFSFKVSPIEGYNSRIIIERHLHHYISNEKMQGVVLKHWIPVLGSKYEIQRDSKRALSTFVEINNQVICMY